MKETDIIDTVQSSIGRWDIVIVETNKITERERVPIKNRTRKGYLMASDGDSIDISKRMVYHRGTVQHGICHTIKTRIDVGIIEIGRNGNKNIGDIKP